MYGVRPKIDATQRILSQVGTWPSESDHVGKSTYSGEIENLDRDPGIVSLDFPGINIPNCY